MIRHDYHRLLLETALSVLEEAAFAPALACPQSADADPSCIVASVSFGGEVSGRLEVAMPASLARLIASNMLGCDETDVTDAQLDDVVGEVGNMICGSLLRRLGYTAREETVRPPVITGRSAPLDPGRGKGSRTVPDNPPARSDRVRDRMAPGAPVQGIQGRRRGERRAGKRPAASVVSAETVTLAVSPERVTVTLLIEEWNGFGS